MAPAGSVVESYLSFVKFWVYFQQWKGKEEIEKCLRNEVINLLADAVYQDIFLSPTSLSLWITESILPSFGKIIMTWQSPQMTKWSASTYFQNNNLKVKIKAPWACHASLNSQMYWVIFKNIEQSSERWDTSGPYRSLSQWPEFHRTLGCSPVPENFISSLLNVLCMKVFKYSLSMSQGDIWEFEDKWISVNNTEKEIGHFEMWFWCNQ